MGVVSDTQAASSKLIRTSYDGHQPENAKMPMPQESAADAVWSECERKLAENAVVVEDLDSLSSKVNTNNRLLSCDSY
jgi:hypothetical protein